MQILTVNVGSSSVKLDRFDGAVEVPRHLETTRLPPGAPLPGTLGTPAVLVHRVVHGGELARPTRIDAGVEQHIETWAPLAPLHNPPALAMIRACGQRFGAQVPQVAVFDTAFFADLPAVARTYALPQALTQAHAVRRHGFHGIAHQALWRAWQAHTRGGGRVVTLQLGAGCSAAAIADGRPLDTSMGFTPLEGLVMATRCGDVDPGLLLHLQRATGLDAAQMEELLSRQSGLLGLAGSADMAALLADPSPQARLAVELYCQRIRKYIGAYAAVLGGLDGIVFGGGVGEHAPAVRARVLADMQWLGVHLDETANAATGASARISTADSACAAWVFEVNEACELARAGQHWLAGTD
ncbi:MAG: acetate/propionate family kinase [Pseudomonadota bacterium]